ncbi:MAG: undecaprenyl-diphosphate phosphatase [Acutalibacteraceae bacterium]|nr:undecaprenyl-diphosphate phosphatase [Acutalibacteraceae bacterium]
MLEFIKSVFYGIIEGITEWLPISSTGHLILFEKFFGFNLGEEFMEFYRVIIQLGAIMAVVILYWKKIWPFHSKKNKIKIAWKTPTNEGFFGGLQKFCENYVFFDKIILWIKILIACLPAAILGLLLDDWLDAHLYNFPTVAVTLLIYGIAFIIVENMRKKGSIKTKTTSLSLLTFKTALIIGAFQVLSMIPGTSRSGATILGAILIGCSREVAAEFSFFLAIPVMFGASLLKAVKLIGSIVFTPQIVICLLTGILVSFIVSVIAIKFLMGYIKKHDFKAFGYYRIILSIVLFIYMIFA